jgi:hypothetical protein
MVMGSKQPLTEMSTRILPARKTDNLATVSVCIENVGASTSHKPLGLHDLLN